MATSKLLKPTNVTISIPAFTDQPDQRVNSNCIDKEADAINSLSDQIANKFKTFAGSYTFNNSGYFEIQDDFFTANTVVFAGANNNAVSGIVFNAISSNGSLKVFGWNWGNSSVFTGAYNMQIFAINP